MNDDDLLFDESDEITPLFSDTGIWKILIVDDEPEVHKITELALVNFRFENKGIEFLHAYSAEEALVIIKSNPDIALTLLDVVMETDHAGLDLVQKIRNEIKNHSIRIVLRTGQPGEAPERDIIVNYDINDYTEKVELSAQKLFTVVVASLRSYRGILKLEDKTKKLLLVNQYNRMLFEQSSTGLALCRMNGDLVDVNPAYAEIIGYTVKQTLKLSYWDVTPKSFADSEQHQLEILKSTGEYGPYEKEYIHKDGHRVPVQLRGQLLERDGETFIWSSVEDITERKRAEDALLESQKMLRLVLDSIHVRVFWKDSDCLYLGCNKLFASDAGLQSPEQIVGMSDFELNWRDQAERYRADDQQVMKNDQPKLNYEEPQSNDDGMRWLRTSKVPLKAPSGKVFGVLGVYENITERKQIEKALRRSQKMEAIGQLSGGIAHDFNNQLGVIIGYLDFLQNHFPEDEKPRHWVDTATRATLRCMDLTRQLLAFSRRESSEKTVVDLNSSIIELKTMIARSVTPEVDVQYSLADKLWLAEIDAGEFQDVILNLVINARDAMPDGGVLLIETGNRNLDADYTALNPGLASGGYVQLMLSDTGSGMDKATLDHMFEPFFTTKPEGKGTGLGMAMVYGFVKRNGGYIKVYSEPDVGTTIRIYLPRTQDVKKVITSGNAVVSSLPGGNESILIVDDEADLLTLASKYLDDLGYRIQTAMHAAQALEILAGDETIDLLFSDVVLPGGMNGYELAQQATELRPALKVLLTSGFTSKTIAHNGQARFAAHLLGKPYRKDDLARQIRLVMDAQAGNQPAIHSTKEYLDGHTILVIDDEEDIRELFRLNLQRLGCKTLLADSGDEALALYQESLESSDPVSVVILDLNLNGSMDGKQVAEKIRGIDPDARIIVSSGHTAGPEMTQYRDYGFNGALEKNFDREKIKEVLEQVLAL